MSGNPDPSTVGFTQPGGGGGPHTLEGRQEQGQPDWKAYMDSLDSKLGGEIEKTLGPKLDELNGIVRRATEVPEPPPEIDYEALTPGQLHAVVMEQTNAVVERAIAAALKPYAEQITGLRTDFATKSGTDEINRLSSAHKDYKDWVPEMKEAATKHPTMSYEEIYLHAKALNPAKAKELETKYNPPPPRPVRPFALGPGSTPDSQTSKPMSKVEAGRAAWDQVNARHGGVLGALEDAFPN